MEAPTAYNKKHEAKEMGAETEAKVESVAKELEKLDELVETREELVKYIKALKIMEEELEEELKRRWDQGENNEKTEKLGLALARLRALRRILKNRVDIIDNTLKSIVNPNKDELIEIVSDEEIYNIVKELSKVVRRNIRNKIKTESIKEDLEDDEEYEKYENSITTEEFAKLGYFVLGYLI
jgi:hypothetical protein